MNNLWKLLGRSRLVREGWTFLMWKRDCSKAMKHLRNSFRRTKGTITLARHGEVTMRAILTRQLNFFNLPPHLLKPPTKHILELHIVISNRAGKTRRFLFLI